MKTTILLISAMLITLTNFAQQLNRVKQWVPTSIQSTNAADSSKQIKNILITDYTGKSYTGTMEYGQSSGTAHPCTVIITGKNITILADKKNWAGKILESGNNNMVVSFGSVVYYFKMAPENQRSHGGTPVIAVN